MSPQVGTVPKGHIWALLKYHRRSFLLCSFISTVSFQYGFDNTMMSTMQASPSFLRVFGFPSPGIPGGYGIDPTVQQLLTSLMTVGGFVGSLVTGYIGNRLGRRMGLL